MSQDNNVDIRIAALTNKSSISQAEKAVSGLADTVDKSVSEINSAAKSSRLLSTAYDKLTQDANDYAGALRNVIAEQSKLSPEQNLANLKANAGLGGNTASAASSSLGGAGAAKGAVRGVLGSSPIAEAADTLADLSEVAGGLVQNAGGLTQAIVAFGPAALLAAGAAAAAAFALGEYNKQSEAQARILGSAIEAQRQLNTQIADGLTTDQARQQLESTNAELAKQQDLLATLENDYKQLEESTGFLSGAAKLLDSTEEELSTQLNTQRDLVANLNAESQGLNSALESGALAANDAAVAEQELAAARTQGVLQAGQEAAALEQARQQTDGKTKEQLQALIDAETDRIGILQAELEVLVASGDVSKEVTDKIAALRNELDLSAQKSDIFKSSIGGALTDVQKQAQTTKTKLAEQEKVNRLLGTSASNASKSLQGLGSSIGGAAKKISFGFDLKVPAKAISDNAKELEKAGIDYANSLIEVQNNLGKSLDEIRLNLSRSLEDLAINTGRNIEDALAGGQFLSIRDIQRDARREAQDLERQATRDRLDAQREGALEILRIEQDLARQRAGIAGGGKVTTGGNAGQIFALTPR